MSVGEAKARIRMEMRERMGALTEARRMEQTRGIVARLDGWEGKGRVRWVGGFVPRRDEPDLWEWLVGWVGKGGGLALPRWSGERGGYEWCAVGDPVTDLETGRYGIREPGAKCGVLDVRLLDFVVVPGIAFDRYGGRLGRGKGFYDRLLESVVGVSCGVGLDEQLIPEVPMEPHDKRLNLVVVPGGLHGPGAPK